MAVIKKSTKKPIAKAQNGRNFGLALPEAQSNYNQNVSDVKSKDMSLNRNKDNSDNSVNTRIKDNTDNSDNSRVKDKSDNSVVNRTKDNSKTKDSRKNKVKYKIAKGAIVNFNTPPQAKNGKSFPDLNKDGKVTKADVLKGRGVIAKKGVTVKKAAPKLKAGGMIKRANGSVSKRGLWDNIRANKGSGKKPTAAMLKQEKKIKAKK